MKAIVTLLLLVSFTYFAIGQTSEIQGQIINKETGEELPFASVVAYLNGIQKGYATADFNGDFTIKPLRPGKYVLKASNVGCQEVEIQEVYVTANRITDVVIPLNCGEFDIILVDIIVYKKPLFEKDQTTKQLTLTSDEIEKIATRNITNLAALSSGIVQRAEGEGLNVRGARSDGTVYIIDGVLVRGSSNLPQSAIEQITTITGGIPAKYGDATGGIISITTKGPSPRRAGGIEVITSEYLDPYGYNLVNGIISGPFLWKDRDTEDQRIVAGYFLTGEYTYRRDSDPSAIGMWKIKDDVLDSLEQFPLQLSPTGSGFVRSAEFITKDDMEYINAKQNVSHNGFALSGKLDFSPTKSTDLVFGGNMYYRNFHSFVRVYSLFNPLNNPQGIRNDWRVYGRFTQVFNEVEEDDEEKDLIDKGTMLRNAFYSVQIDFTKNKGKTQDDSHQDNLFNYGHVGKFTTYKAPAYVFGYDSTVELTGWLLSSLSDTLLTFEPGTANPLMARYTSVYYDLVDAPPMNRTDLLLGGGLENGQRPGNVYSLWYNTGRQYNFWGYSADDEQLSLSIEGSVDISVPSKSDPKKRSTHAVEFGFKYEQRWERYYGINPIGLWDLMRQLTNRHISDLDIDNPIKVEDINGIFLDTINYDRLYVETDHSFFDKQLRASLGLDEKGTDWIDVHSLDPSTFDLSMFSADELLNQGSNYIFYYGYDHLGNRLKKNPSYNDFFRQKDAFDNYTRAIGAYSPIYTAGYIQDKFSFHDLRFNIGLRVDAFDANQQVLKDKYSLYDIQTRGEIDGSNNPNGSHPSNIGNEYAVYVRDFNAPTPTIVGYRDKDTWYDINGVVVTDPSILAEASSTGLITPLLNPGNVNDIKDPTFDPSQSFEDYSPQVTLMPRIAFSFPISEEANFYAHYDVYTQRPKSVNLGSPFYYYYFEERSTGSQTNPALKPEKTIEYEAGFKQQIGKSSALSLSAFYRELRDMIQITRVNFAYPIAYTSFDNIDFGNVKGMELGYDLRRGKTNKNVSMIANYTLSFAEGTGSSAGSQGGIIGSDNPNLRSVFPLNFDQRHAINIIMDYRFFEEKDYNGPKLFGKDVFSNAGANITFVAGSGRPYSPQDAETQNAAFGIAQRAVLEGTINGSRLPWTYRANARLDKSFEIKTGDDKDDPKHRYQVNVYLQVLNVLNTRNVISVYRYTGIATDDGWLSSAKGQAYRDLQLDPESYTDLYNIKVNNPSSYDLPRRIRLGLVFNF